MIACLSPIRYRSVVMFGARRGAWRRSALFFLVWGGVAAGSLRAVVGCAAPYAGSDAFDATDLPPKKDSGDVMLGDAVAGGEAGCGQAICMTQLSLGGSFGCALGDDTIVRCWGDNDTGQTGSPDTAPSQAPRAVGGLGPVKQITTGTRHACALQMDGKVLCWGDDEHGLVSGTPGLTAKPSPFEIPGLLRPVAKIIAISDHQCAILDNADLYCWGNNEYGQLGVANVDGGDPVKSIPRPTLTLATVVQVGGCEETTCALRTSGQVSCVGRNFSGDLGNNTSDLNPHPSPVTVTGLLSPVGQLASGTGYHIAVALSDGRVQGWGSNARNALVPTPGVFQIMTATLIPGISSVVEVAAGGYFTCARSTGGKISCWGDNSGGQTGVVYDGGANTAPPKEVPGVSAADRIAVGRTAFACAITAGKIVCWGNNDKGQLGRGSLGGSFPMAAKIQL